jgi:uncharacterized protein
MDFEWDEAKRQSNLEKHTVDFRFAALIFEGPVVVEPDNRQDYGEERLLAIGYFREQCFVVAHTKRGTAIRLISAWKGGRRDRRKYQAVYG